MTRTSILFISVFAAPAMGAQAADVVRCTDPNGGIAYTDGPCPAGTKLARQVAVTEPLSVVLPSPEEEARRAASTPPPPLSPSQVSNAPQGPAIIPRNVDERRLEPEPPPVYSWGPDPYRDGGRPIIRPHPPRPPRPQDHGPPPGHRPCQNLAGIKRNNC
ncbi:hypothetical protein [Variovorax paradoxus]|uniref:hypothetical protein n=1 Tax=Variovorax paradoxus TaxID=34073 RepID=UPI003D654731